jgi:hypothetical protein
MRTQARLFANRGDMGIRTARPLLPIADGVELLHEHPGVLDGSGCA